MLCVGEAFRCDLSFDVLETAMGSIVMFRILYFTGFFAVSSLPTSAAEPQSASDDDVVRAAIATSLPFIQREGVNWIEKRQCVSCHQVPFMVWSLNAAAHRGFDVDSKQLKSWNEWAIDWQNFSAPRNRKQQDEKQTATRNVDTIYQLLLASQHYQLEDLTELKLWALASRLLGSQQEDGSWKPCGQLPLQKRPARETAEVTTMWTLVAFSHSDSADPAREARQKLAARWLAEAKEGQSTEWWAVKLLLSAAEKENKSIAETRKQLTSYQHDDGGWGWLTRDKSDAMGTGVALYALCRSGRTQDDPVILKARQFLLNSQQKEGTWRVNGTKTKSAQRVTKTATYWGTCWAVIGLLESIRPGPVPALPPE